MEKIRITFEMHVQDGTLDEDIEEWISYVFDPSNGVPEWNPLNYCRPEPIGKTIVIDRLGRLRFDNRKDV